MKRLIGICIFSCSLLLVTGTRTLAAATAPGEINWGEMVLGLCGGLALFLFGMGQLTDHLKAATGAQLKLVLARLTTNRFAGALSGAFVTAIIQSSSVTTVLVVGFASAGLMTLSQSIGVVMGANIGTTITAQIIAFKVVKFALGFIAIGFLALFLGRSEKIRQGGGILFSSGLIFFGMSLMGDAMSPLHSYEPFLRLMSQIAEPGFGILLGALFTALVQSSSATTGIIIVMAGQGFVSLPAGIALSLGANIGTCITALLAALGKPRSALRVAAVHVLFNVAGVLVWIGFIDQLATLATLVSPRHAELGPLARLAAETPRQIANANTLFNTLNTFLFIGFTVPIARLTTQLLPDRAPGRRPKIVTTRYLDEKLLTTPSLALNMARLEIGHLGQQVLLMLTQAQNALENRDMAQLQALKKQDDAADILYAEIIGFLNRVGKQTLTEEDSQEFFRLNQAAANLESIGDLLETDLREVGQKLIASRLEPSRTMERLLAELHRCVYLGLEAAVRAITDNDERSAQDVITMKHKVDSLVRATLERQAESLAASDEERLTLLNIEFEITDKLKRVHTLSKRIARLWVPKQV